MRKPGADQAVAHPGGLDAASIRVVTRVGVVTALCLLVAAFPVLAGWSGLPDALSACGTCLSLAALCRIIGATRSGTRPGGGSLNGWDESLFLSGGAALLHGLHRLFW